METFEKILVLNNEYEAELMAEVLNDKGIPHGIVASDDSVMEGIVQMEYGWGYLEAPPRYRDEINRIASEVRMD